MLEEKVQATMSQVYTPSNSWSRAPEVQLS